jgi:hypothetical protein
VTTSFRNPSTPSDTRSVPLVVVRWSENAGREALAERCQGRCEGCGRVWHGQACHRLRKSQGGGWAPHNLLALCGSGTTGCHGLIGHGQGTTGGGFVANGLGWEVEPGQDPELRAVWILTPHLIKPSWHQLTYEDDGATGVRRHVVRPVEPRWVA